MKYSEADMASLKISNYSAKIPKQTYVFRNIINIQLLVLAILRMKYINRLIELENQNVQARLR